MNRSKRINKILQTHLTDFTFNIIDSSHLHKGHNDFNGTGETHITLELKGITKHKISRLQVHRHINSLVKDEFNRGLHSLEIKIFLKD